MLVFNNMVTYCLLLQAKISADPEQYIAAPAGMQFHEVTASGLVKVNSSGSLTDSGSLSLAPTKATFSFAAAMHTARADVKSVVFLCNPSAVSVSVPLSLQYYYYYTMLYDAHESKSHAHSMYRNCISWKSRAEN